MLALLISLVVAPAFAEESKALPVLIAQAIGAQGYRLYLHPRERAAPIHIFACARDTPCQRPAIAERELPQPHHFDDRPGAEARWKRIESHPRPEP